MFSITLDTNIYISALNYGGKPRRILEMADAGLVHLDCSEIILVETLRILHDKFAWSDQQLLEAEAQIRRLTRIVTPQNLINVIAEDPEDNRILECAVEAKSDFLVSGDKDLLRLKTFDSLRIITAAQFLELAGA